MKRRVVITGIGPVCAAGIGKEEFFNNIIDLKTHVLEIPKSYEKNYTFKSRYYVAKPTFRLSDFKISKSVEVMMEEISKISVLCTKLALEDAGFRIQNSGHYFQVDGLDRCTAILGIGMSSLQTAFESYSAHTAESDGLNVSNGAEPRFNRMVIPMLMPNSASAWVSIIFGIKGLNYTVNASCASGSFAIGEAYRNILDGRCDTAVTGGIEALAEKNGAVMRGFDMLTTLTKSNDGIPQPFSKKRSGFLFNEGAGCILVLEELQHALNRGANIYAEIVGYEASSDAYNILQMEPSGENIENLFNKLINGLKIDYINAHGTGTVLNDEVEAKVIQRIFGDVSTQPLINSTKGILGHSIGASGALEAAVTAMSIQHEKIHGNLLTDPIENLNLPLNSIETQIQYAISASYGFGGHNVLILFKRYNENE